MINARQIKAARALLGMDQQSLAALAKCGIATVRRIEASTEETVGNASSLARIERALRQAGVLFIDQDDNHGPGVRLTRLLPEAD